MMRVGAVAIRAAFLEVALTPDDGNPPLSGAAEDLDDHARGLVSDLTDFDVRKHKPKRLSDLTNWRIGMAFFLLVVAIVVAVLYASGTLDPGPAFTGAPADVVSPTMSVVNSDGDGPVGGTWIMDWTNVNGIENHAFTVVFAGTDTGTVEILGDDTVHDGAFRLKGDQISFTFSRTFDLPTGDWSEASEFEGTLVDADKILGVWTRQDWSCAPDDDPPCTYGPEPIGFSSRLVRQP